MARLVMQVFCIIFVARFCELVVGFFDTRGAASEQVNLGKELLATDRRAAISVFETYLASASKRSSGYFDAVMGLASALQGEGRFKEALEHYKKIEEKDPNQGARAFATEQIRKVKKLSALHPRKVRAIDAQNAQEVYKQSLQKDPSYRNCQTGVTGWNDVLSEKVLAVLDMCMPEVLKSMVTGRQLTNWLERYSMKRPKNVMERVIQMLRPLVPIAEDGFLGVEWWFTNDSALIGQHFHIDKDSASEDKVKSIPSYSSMLYLSDKGGATYILPSNYKDDGERVALPLNGTASFPKRGQFIVFDGGLVQGVVPPVESDAGDRTLLGMNWWSKHQPMNEKCDIFPLELAQKTKLKPEILKKILLLDKRSAVEKTCVSADEIWKESHYSDFGAFLPVVSQHSPGQLLAINWMNEFAAHDEF